jgi:5,10-methylenetetrahydrofolate reductase
MDEMPLRTKLKNLSQPVILYELIPPRLDDAAALEQNISFVRELAGKVDGINIPEIRDETRRGVRRAPQPKRIEPRVFAKAIQDQASIRTIINRVTVHESAEEQTRWLAETYGEYGIENLILVGGESRSVEYPGPGVEETAAISLRESIPYTLGGITIPSRSGEAARIRRKYAGGLRFFTTQVLLDSNDIVDLVQALNGLDVWIFLSFAPMSSLRDVEFLRWLGVDVPKNVEWSITQAGDAENAVERTITHAAKILTDVFDHLPSHPPGVGINIEQITQRNHKPAAEMLEKLGGFYRHLLHARGAMAGAREMGP